MAYSWDNRVRFVVRHMYDTDNNGFLDMFDFECLSLKYTVLEGKGEYNADKHSKNKELMTKLWQEMAAIADFDKDGQVSVDEFKKGVKEVCLNKKFDQFPESLRHAIKGKFLAMDINGDGLVGLEEFRIDCVCRSAFKEIKEIDDSYNKLVSEGDIKAGGLTLARYQELYAEFIGSAEDNVPGTHLFGPLPVVE